MVRSRITHTYIFSAVVYVMSLRLLRAPNATAAAWRRGGHDILGFLSAAAFDLAAVRIRTPRRTTIHTYMFRPR